MAVVVVTDVLVTDVAAASPCDISCNVDDCDVLDGHVDASQGIRASQGQR